MKFRITIKDPDGIYEGIQQAAIRTVTREAPHASVDSKAAIAQNAARLAHEDRRKLSAAEAEVERLRAIIEAEIKDCPTDADFALGGRFDYDYDCGNSDDVAKKYEAEGLLHFAKRMRAALTPAPAAAAADKDGAK